MSIQSVNSWQDGVKLKEHVLKSAAQKKQNGQKEIKLSNGIFLKIDEENGQLWYQAPASDEDGWSFCVKWQIKEELKELSLADLTYRFDACVWKEFRVSDLSKEFKDGDQNSYFLI